MWLDALVQRRVLTSFQARSIETSEFDRLTIGPSVVLDQIGHGPDSETYLTKLPHERETCIVKRVSIATELRGPILKRLQRLTERGRSCQHPGVVIPHASRELPASAHGRTQHRAGTAARLVTQTRLAIVSRPAEGLTLAQMLLRRGRFPERFVLEIARQLLDTVAALHDCKIVHGEIRLDNLLLSSRGQVVMVDCGVRPAIRPAFEINAFVGPERNDGIAPELIGTGDTATPASDLYAIGCLLWQLLAGRPAHPTGDPLAKLAAHQTERISDVRELAPETSARLAEALLRLTSPNAKDRPAHAREILSGPSSQRGDSKRLTLGPPGRRTRTILAKFAGEFHHPVARLNDPTRRPKTARRVALAATAMLIAVGALHLFSGRDAIPASIDQFNHWLQTQYDSLTHDTHIASAADDASAEVVIGALESADPLPEPSADGLLELPHAGPWEASAIVWSGAKLTLKGPTGERARIVVRGNNWQIRAAELHLENLVVELNDDVPVQSESGLAAGVDCQSQSLTMSHCAIHSSLSDEAAETAERAHPFALRWQTLDGDDPLAGQVAISDCQFIGSRSSVAIASPTRILRAVRTLKLAGGPLFAIASNRVPVSRTIDLDHVTVRDSSSVVAIQVADAAHAGRSRFVLHSNDCVYSLSDWQSEPGSLVTYIGQRLPPDWFQFVVLDGRDSVAAPQTTLASLLSPDASDRLALDDSRISLRGLISTAIEFRGSASFEPADSVLAKIAANHRSSDLPGIPDYE